MVSKFPVAKLREIARVRSGFAFKSNDWLDTGVPVVKIANINDGCLVMGSCSFVSAGVAADAGFSLQKNDIVISMTGAYLGEVAWVRQTDIPAVLNQRVGLFSILDDNLLDRRFLFYVLRSPEKRAEIHGLGYGSAQPNVSPHLILDIEIPLPGLQEQRTIGCILGTLDDKIELNRRMNQTLEAMARAIFRSWFIDFKPVLTRGSLPTAQISSKLGLIPEGWIAKPLDSIADFLNGLALQKFSPSDEGSMPVIKIADLRRGSTEGSERAGLDVPDDYVVENGTVLFSWSGTLEVVVWTGGRGALNQHIFSVSSRSYPKWFYLYWLKEHLPSFRAIAADKATTMGHIQRRHLTQAMAAVPPSKVLQAMDQIMAPLLEKQIQNSLESKTLTALRDALLPKLLSGEIRVKQAEEIVREFV